MNEEKKYLKSIDANLAMGLGLADGDIAILDQMKEKIGKNAGIVQEAE
jgi:hypothetical protein